MKTLLLAAALVATTTATAEESKPDPLIQWQDETIRWCIEDANKNWKMVQADAIKELQILMRDKLAWDFRYMTCMANNFEQTAVNLIKEHGRKLY